LLILLLSKGRNNPIIISAGVVTIVTAFFTLRGVRSKHATRERIVLLFILAAFFGTYVYCILVADWLWIAWIAKLTLELLLCYAIMISRKSTADAAQSRIVACASKSLKIKPGSLLAKLLSNFDPL
jgi:hypothetical protein